MIEREILETLQTEIQSAIQGCPIPNLPVKYAGVTFDPPNDQKYLETVYIPNNPTDRCWDETKVYRGAFRLILHWPNNGQGVYTAMDVLQSIAGYFKKNEKYGILRVLNTPDFTGSIEQGSETLHPVSIRYQVFQS